VRTLLALVLLLQFGATEAPGPVASPEHLRWQRAVQLPAGVSGQACAVLDATVYAHAGSRSADDLRLYAGGVETPYVQITSEPVAADVQSATVRNLGMRGGDVVFDLAMPARAYTDVVLKLAGKNFVATAKVSAPDAKGESAKTSETQLGTFALFDLSQQGLSRSTTLPLQESTFQMLHVELHMTAIDGKPYPGLTAQIVEGADIPPSREAQTLHSPVALTSSVTQKGNESIVTFQIPAHVPVERVAFGIAPGFTKEFSRSVTVSAHAAKKDDAQPNYVEQITGEIWRITRDGTGGGPAIHQEKLGVDAEIASNLREPATVTVTVENGDDTPLPIQNVQLQMRQRTMCFDAAAGASYLMRYGDPALHAPVYDYARLFQPQTKPIAAQLGPELANPDYHPRPDERPYTERHPELMWVALILVVAALGGTALHSVKKKTVDSSE
jgi:hypothetical protein